MVDIDPAGVGGPPARTFCEFLDGDVDLETGWATGRAALCQLAILTGGIALGTTVDAGRLCGDSTRLVGLGSCNAITTIIRPNATLWNSRWSAVVSVGR